MKNNSPAGHRYGLHTGDMAAIAQTQEINEMLGTLSAWSFRWAGRLALFSILILSISPLFQSEQSASPNRGDGRNTSTIITEK